MEPFQCGKNIVRGRKSGDESTPFNSTLSGLEIKLKVTHILSAYISERSIKQYYSIRHDILTLITVHYAVDATLNNCERSYASHRVCQYFAFPCVQIELLFYRRAGFPPYQESF